MQLAHYAILMQVADVGLFPVLTEAFGEDVPFVDRIPADVVEQYREAHDQPICLRVLFQQPLGIAERDRDMDIVLANPQIGSRCCSVIPSCIARLASAFSSSSGRNSSISIPCTIFAIAWSGTSGNACLQ